MNTIVQDSTAFNSSSTQRKLHWNFVDITIYLHFFIPSYILFKEPFEFYVTYLFIILYLPFLMFKYTIPRGIWWMLIILLITGLLNVWLDNNTYKNFFKIYINIAINLLFYSNVMAYYNFDVEEMFRRYLKGAVIVSIFGIIELLTYKVGLFSFVDLRNYGFNKWGITPGGLGIRVNSTYPEPAYFAEMISPAAFIAIYNLLFQQGVWLKRWETFVILGAFILSFSSLAFTGIFIILFLILLNYGLVRYFLLFVPLAVFLFFVIYKNVEEFRGRVDGIVLLFVEDYLLEEKEREVTNADAFMARQYRVLTRVQGSALVLYNNYYVALQNFKANPLFGTGLGSHEIAFEKYNLNYLISKWYVLNTPDANSMGLRIISELGLMGVIFTILFLRNYFVIRDINNLKDKRWLISGALFTMLFIQILRNGNYTYAGFIFFAWLYYTNGINKNHEKKNDPIVTSVQ